MSDSPWMGVLSIAGFAVAALLLLFLLLKADRLRRALNQAFGIPLTVGLLLSGVAMSVLTLRGAIGVEVVDAIVGETGMAFYRAESVSSERTVGTATFNVTPLKAGQYFVKTECFCFTEQALDPGQVADMPVSFYIDPGILEDSNLDDTNTITLSYTFYRKKDAEESENEKAAATNDNTAALESVQPVN